MSKMTKTQLKKLSMEELQKILTEQYNESLIGDEKEADLIAMILDHQKKADDKPAADADADTTDTTDDEPPAPPVKTAPPAAGKKKLDPNQRVWLKIFNDDSPTGTQDVFLSVNDDNVNIKREKWVYVKMLHVRALGRAMETHYKRQKNQHGNEVQVENNVRRYKFDVRQGGPKDIPEDSDEVDALSALN